MNKLDLRGENSQFDIIVKKLKLRYIFLCFPLSLLKNILLGRGGAMYRVCSSRKTAPDCPFQPLTAWNWKGQFVTAQSQCFLFDKKACLILPLCSVVPFHFDSKCLISCDLVLLGRSQFLLQFIYLVVCLFIYLFIYLFTYLFIYCQILFRKLTCP